MAACDLAMMTTLTMSLAGNQCKLCVRVDGWCVPSHPGLASHSLMTACTSNLERSRDRLPGGVRRGENCMNVIGRHSCLVSVCMLKLVQVPHAAAQCVCRIGVQDLTLETVVPPHLAIITSQGCIHLTRLQQVPCHEEVEAHRVALKEGSGRRWEVQFMQTPPTANMRNVLQMVL